MATNQLDLIMSQVQRLPVSDQMQLLQRVMSLLTKTKSVGQTRGLVYGKYHNTQGSMSTEEDFKLAEWHLREKDVNGE